MKKLIAGVALAALMASPALATGNGNGSDDPKGFDIQSPVVDLEVQEFKIEDTKISKDRKREYHVKFYNVLDVYQHGNKNFAGIYQKEDGSRYNLNGSWTVQLGNYNADIGIQSAKHNGWNMRKVTQIGPWWGGYNGAATLQVQKGYGQNVLEIGQYGLKNKAGVIQLGEAVGYYGASTNVMNIQQSGAFNAALAVQFGKNAGNFGEITQYGHGNKAITVQRVKH